MNLGKISNYEIYLQKQSNKLIKHSMLKLTAGWFTQFAIKYHVHLYEKYI